MDHTILDHTVISHHLMYN